MTGVLFQRGAFTLASGKVSSWKIECDALDPEDWMGLAAMASETVLKGQAFRQVIGVPRGGWAFADALGWYVRLLNPAAGGKVLLVEDVVTTGKSIDNFRRRYKFDLDEVVGICAFARGVYPPWVRPLFRIPEYGGEG